MSSQPSERYMHQIRWVLTLGWLLIILSLFYDPWTKSLTIADHPWSPLRLPDECVQLQGQCVVQTPYPIGTTVFWGAVVPAGIFILLIFGHEIWRRICPLSFLSQIPRALGKQRQLKKVNQKSGKVRFEIAKVNPDSWIGRHHQDLQFGYLFIGLCGRILFFNADRLVLGAWLLFTVCAAIFIGYFYGGKSWCQYFCPMAPVQTIYSEPRGLLGTKAHMSDSRISQSMCRTVSAEGREQSACVACQSPCFDIDSERTYWDGIQNPQELRIRFGYLGLMIGYILYYYLYAGNWDYYFSGVWSRDSNQLASLMNPGIYLVGQPIYIPKLFAVPLVLGIFTLMGIAFGSYITRLAETEYRSILAKNPYFVRHRIFSLVTFIAFNIFFLFGGRPLLMLMPHWIQFFFNSTIVFASTLWLWQSWDRNPSLYNRESLANRLRGRLGKLDLNLDKALGGRSLETLNADEVFVLAKVLPGFTQEKRHQAYKGVLHDALAEGYVSTSSSLFVLQQMRKELDISENEHREVLEELGVEDPSVLNPSLQHSVENQVRLNGYQQSLERLLRLQRSQKDISALGPSVQTAENLQALRSEYSITLQEEQWVLQDLNLERTLKAQNLTTQLRSWLECSDALNYLPLQEHEIVLTVIKDAVSKKHELIVNALLDLLPILPDQSEAERILVSIYQVIPPSLQSLVDEHIWIDSLGESVKEVLSQMASKQPKSPLALSTQSAIAHLQNLLQHPRPLVVAASLFLLAHLDQNLAIKNAQALNSGSKLLREVTNKVKTLQATPILSRFPTLEKCVYLYSSDFFHGLDATTLCGLAERAEVRSHAAGEAITEAGDTCRELLILVEGEANIQYQIDGKIRREKFSLGQAIDELEVLGNYELENSILAVRDGTRILAVPVDTFDALIDQDREFARRVMTLESQRIKQLMHTTHAESS